jgi:hypothetical protein
MLLTFSTQITPLMRQAKAVGPKKSNYYVPAKEGKGRHGHLEPSIQ